MKNLQIEINKILQNLGIDSSLGIIQLSNRPELSDYQMNGCFQIGKILSKNPLDIANTIVSEISESLKLEYDFTAVKPGFINIKLKDKTLLKLVKNNLDIKPINQSVVIDYGSPNVAKGMHVGHLRSTLIGNALVKMYKFAGYKVIGDNHIGDWGTPLGIVITQIINSKLDISLLTLNDIEKLYIEGSLLYKNDELFKESVLLNTSLLQKNDSTIKAIWLKVVEKTKESLIQAYNLMGIHFDEWNGESSFEQIIPLMIQELIQKKFVYNSNGAHLINLDPEPPLMLTKSNGSYLYHTTDLACIKTRTNYDKILYVVDNRQSLHFKQVFTVALKTGYIKPNQAFHVDFGTINGKDGKPFKTRDGEVLKLMDLINQVFEESKNRINKTLSVEEQNFNYPIIAMGALKFAELKHNRTSDYIFDLEKFLSLEGFTGPAVMYSGVRAKSILNKMFKNYQLDENRELNIQEKKLLLKLMQFTEYFNKSLQNNEPHIICEYAYDLANIFNSFYQENHIQNEKNIETQKHFLWIVNQFYLTIETSLNLLGITLPEKM